jgi:hypothetical protein
MRRSIFERELLPGWRKRLLNEIAPNDPRAHCAATRSVTRQQPQSTSAIS